MSPDSEPQPGGFAVERFEYATADLLLRLSVRLSLELPRPEQPMLFVECGPAAHAYPALLACTGRAPLKAGAPRQAGALNDACELWWRGAFAVPPNIACDPTAMFALRLREEIRLALPAPRERGSGAEQRGGREADARTRPYLTRRGALLFVLYCQLALVAGWSTGALAVGSRGTTTTEPTTEAPPKPPPGSSGESTPPTTTEASPPPPPPPPVTTTNPGPGAPEAGTGNTPTSASATPPPASTPTPPQAPPTTPAPAPASTTTPAGTVALTVTEGPTVKAQRRRRTTSDGKVSPTAARAKPGKVAAKRSEGTARAPVNGVAPAPQVVATQAASLAVELAGSAGSAQALAYYRIPLFLLPIYKAAALRYEVPWQILAAINEIETNYGSDLSVSSAGAVGWMQFMPATWIQYGVDALNAGYADPYHPVDAIFAAARYLRAAGAHTNLRAAIFAYNHSAAYVDSVLLRARLISAYPQLAIGTLTGLVDARLPVSGRQIAWRAVASAVSASDASPGARALADRAAASTAPARPGSVAPPSPSAAAAGVIRSAAAATRAPQLVELLSAPNAAVVAVRDGRILQLGSSRKLGKFLVLRDAYGDVFTYTGLGSIAATYAPPKVPRPPRTAAVGPRGHEPATKQGARAGGRLPATLRLRPHTRSETRAVGLPLRIGSVVSEGTVLGHVRVPPQAKDGHLRFAIRPAGDPDTIDPRPILANWRQLETALHPQGAKGESVSAGHLSDALAIWNGHGVAHSAGTGRPAPSPLVLGGELTAAQWDQLIARIAALPVPNVATKPSASAIPDPAAAPGTGGLGSGQLPPANPTSDRPSAPRAR